MTACLTPVSEQSSLQFRGDPRAPTNNLFHLSVSRPCPFCFSMLRLEPSETGGGIPGRSGGVGFDHRSLLGRRDQSTHSFDPQPRRRNPAHAFPSLSLSLFLSPLLSITYLSTYVGPCAPGLLVLKGHSLQDRWHGLTAPFMSFVLLLGHITERIRYRKFPKP